eukprot:s979_g11.t1
MTFVSGELYAWWQTGVAKDDFEKFRTRLIEEERKRKKEKEKGDDEAFSFDDEEPPPEGERDVIGDAERGIAKDLSKLKREVSREPLKRKEISKKPQAKARAGGDKRDSRDRQKRSRTRSRERGRGRRAAGSGEKAERSSEDESDSEKKKKKKRSRSPSRGRDDRKTKKKKARTERDRGPYGVGKAMDFSKDDSGGSGSDSDDPDFRGGGSDKRSHQLRLVEYSQKRPGRLTSRLLTKMQGLLSRDAGPPILSASSQDLTPPTATSYLLTVMIPTYRERLGVRLLRELRTACAALDNIACGRGEVAADILSQRVKALELQLNDNGWQRAQFLELIAPEGAGLAEQDEQRMAARENALEQKMQNQLKPRTSWSGEGKGKGEYPHKGKGKKGGKKGKWSTPEGEKEKPPAA